jgi:PTH1 family peptidyl-tRNA hydrolase
MYLIVGLGNPGKEYQNTKHNLGFMALDLLGSDWEEKFQSLICKTQICQQDAILAKPQTFMNLSGESVQPLSEFFKIDQAYILVIHDELDIPFGQVHFKMGGGLAGHNGLKSIAASLGTDQFARMRIGIGRPVHGSVANWVLSPFSKEEQIHLPLLIEKLHDPMLNCVVEGLGKVGIYNKKNLLA